MIDSKLIIKFSISLEVDIISAMEKKNRVFNHRNNH